MEQLNHFGISEEAWEKQIRDPDDVLLAAEDRKQEIKDKMKELERGVRLQNFKRKSKPR